MEKVSSEESHRLLFMFRELANYWKELGRGQEHECLALIDLLDKTRLKWLGAQNENEGLKAMLEGSEQETNKWRTDNKMLKEQLKDARAQIASLMSVKSAAETDLAEYERKFDLVRQLLKDELANLPAENQRQLAFLKEEKCRLGIRANGASFSVVDQEGVDYDKTGDSLEEEASFLRSGRCFRRSDVPPVRHKRSHEQSVPRQPPIAEEEQFEVESPHPRKRSKEIETEETEEIVATAQFLVDPSGVRPSRAQMSVTRRSLNRSFSEPRVGQHGGMIPSAPEDQRQAAGGANRLTPSRLATGSVTDLRVTPTLSGPLSGAMWTGGSPIEQRGHLFVSKKQLLLREYCDVCSKRIGFGAVTLRCTDCRTTCHEQCRGRALTPCVPRQATPKTPGGGGQRFRLVDLCPNRPPMIPHIIIHCVVELEKRHLATEGLYRIPGSERQVQDLLNKFKTSRGVPNLAETDPELITGVIKKFLQELREPLIPTTSWKEFVQAAEQQSEERLYRYIADLPTPNRDTLAYLCAHWQKVAESCEVNRMPLSNLARVLGPTVVGYSMSSGINLAQASVETAKQSTVMMGLLSLPHEYWRRYFESCSVALLASGASPLPSPDVGDRSLLGPITRTPRAGQTPSLQRSTKKAYFQPVWK